MRIDVTPGVRRLGVAALALVALAGAGCRQGMYTSCLNYGLNYEGHNKGHRANGFTTDGGFAQYAVNHINTLVHVADDMSDEEATLVVTADHGNYGKAEDLLRTAAEAEPGHAG